MSAQIEESGELAAALRALEALKERLEEIMRRPKVTPRDAEEAAEAARALADLLRGQERALRLIRPEAPNSQSDPGGTRASEPLGSLAGLALHEAARRVLASGGWPMHVRELGVAVKAGGWRHPRSKRARPDQIEYQLAARLPRHSETFKKFAPNTFGLTVWGDAPPRTARPKPHVGTMGHDPTYRGPGARELSEHPERWYDEMVRDERD